MIDLALDLVIGQHRRAVQRQLPLEHLLLDGGNQTAAEQGMCLVAIPRGTSHARRRGVAGRPGPVASALEGIGGQRSLASGVGTVEAGPIDFRPADVQLSQAIEHRLPVVAPRPQRRQPPVVSFHKAAPAQADERRAGTDLQKDLATPVGQHLHALGKPHRRAGVAAPIARVGKRMLVGQLARQVGHDVDLRRSSRPPSRRPAAGRPASDPSVASGRRARWPAAST